MFGSQSEKCDVNGSESMSAKVSGAMDAPSAGTAFGPLKPSIGWDVRSALSRVCRGSAVNTEGSNSLWLPRVL